MNLAIFSEYPVPLYTKYFPTENALVKKKFAKRSLIEELWKKFIAFSFVLL